MGYAKEQMESQLESAKELVEAPIFDGKSLQERWNSVVICSIEGCGLDDWINFFPHI